jgi:hypothetical protein
VGTGVPSLGKQGARHVMVMLLTFDIPLRSAALGIESEQGKQLEPSRKGFSSHLSSILYASPLPWGVSVSVCVRVCEIMELVVNI